MRRGCWASPSRSAGSARLSAERHSRQRVEIMMMKTLAIACLLTGLGASALTRTSASGQPAAMQRIPQFDNDRATSWLSVIPPHTESTMHRHDRYRSVIAIVGGDLKTISPSGQVTVTHYETGKSYW